MKYRAFAKTGFKVSVVGMGTYYDPVWIVLATVFKVHLHRPRILEALKTGLDLGINFIDTAEIYQSEPIISEAINGRKRDELFIASKVWSNHLKPEKVLKSCKRSLEKLGTKYLDLYQIHFPNSRVRIRETMGALEKLVDDGLIRAIGVSNFSYSQMLEAEASLSHAELSSTQMHYNLMHRDVELEILPHCEKQKIAMIAYYPIAHGKLAKSSRIEKLDLRPGVKLSKIALDWLIQRSEMNFPIPRASRPAHVKDNAGATDFELTESDMKNLDQAYPLTKSLFAKRKTEQPEKS